MATYQIRHAARILLLDERQRVLLLRVDDEAPWHTIGQICRRFVTPSWKTSYLKLRFSI